MTRSLGGLPRLPLGVCMTLLACTQVIESRAVSPRLGFSQQYGDLVMFSRRLFLAASGSALWIPATGSAHPDKPVFSLGVTSGSPRANSVVLWTRLAPDPLRGGGMPPGRTEVRYRVCSDPEMRRTVRTGLVATSELKGHSVHAQVDGLQPGREYFYQFIYGEEESLIGRTKTSDPRASRASFALANCQHLESNHFAAYRDLAEWNADCVIHVGDYIYEGASGSLGPQRREYQGNIFEWENVRQHEGEEIVTLTDYRNRYAQYRLDTWLQKAHASAPWLVAFDDHEVDNNWAGLVPQDPEQQSAEFFELRRRAAFQAFYEHMPLEQPPTFDQPGGQLQLYGGYRFGPAAVSLLDTRQYRSDQVCGQGFPADFPCDELNDPNRTMTGHQQEDWLLSRFSQPESPVHVVAQQTWFGPYRYTEDEDGRLWNMDQWDGYPVQRQRILDAMAVSDAETLVLSGDWHCAMAMSLHREPENQQSDRVGTNLAATSIASRCPWYPAIQQADDINPHVAYTNGDQRGYLRVTVDNQRKTTAEFRTVVDPSDPRSACVSDAQFKTSEI